MHSQIRSPGVSNTRHNRLLVCTLAGAALLGNESQSLGQTAAPQKAPAVAPAPASPPKPPAASAPAPAPAPAKPAAPTLSPEEERIAQEHYRNGAEFFRSGKYAQARTEFEAAYGLTKLPDLLYNLAKVEEKEGNKEKEAAYLQQYLASNPEDAAAVQARLALIKPAGGADLPKFPVAAAGIMAGGLAALVVGFACGGAALSTARQIEDPANYNKQFTPELINLQESGKRLNTAAILFDVVGGLALAGGGAWIGYWYYQRHQAKKALAPKTAFLPIGPGSLGFSLIGSY